MRIQIGQKFDQLTVIAGPVFRNKRTYYICDCLCGQKSEARHDSLLSGNTRSCGCLIGTTKKHGHTANGLTSGEYHSWDAMQRRCNNPRCSQYPNYGGRGISVCERWSASFEDFLADMGSRPSPKHSLDRIDVNGNYEPTNCRWATVTEQGNNRRTNKQITYNGETRTYAEWERYLNWPPGTIGSRIRLGWSQERALQFPHKERPKAWRKTRVQN